MRMPPRGMSERIRLRARLPARPVKPWQLRMCRAYGPAVYAQQAIYRAAEPAEADAAVARERDWQYHHLLQLRESKP